jgi:cGMP-dependent 3',5'-cyclic phosphodiesterase
MLFVGDLADLLREIMMEARKLTNAERCSLFLLDSEHDHLVAKIFDGETSTEVSFERLSRFSPVSVCVGNLKALLCLTGMALSRILAFIHVIKRETHYATHTLCDYSYSVTCFFN